MMAIIWKDISKVKKIILCLAVLIGVMLAVFVKLEYHRQKAILFYEEPEVYEAQMSTIRKWIPESYYPQYIIYNLLSEGYPVSSRAVPFTNELSKIPEEDVLKVIHEKLSNPLSVRDKLVLYYILAFKYGDKKYLSEFPKFFSEKSIGKIFKYMIIDGVVYMNNDLLGSSIQSALDEKKYEIAEKLFALWLDRNLDNLVYTDKRWWKLKSEKLTDEELQKQQYRQWIYFNMKVDKNWELRKSYADEIEEINAEMENMKQN